MQFFACCKHLYARGGVFKTLLIMKLTSIFLIVLCLNASAGGYSQKVNIDQRNVPLNKVFKEIKKQTGFTFVYTEGLLRQATRVTITISNASLEQALEACFQNQPLSYSIFNKMVVIKEKDPIIVTEIPLTSPISILIKGEVVNEKGEALSGATVTEKGTDNATTTKEDGSFVINVANEKSILIFSFIGYEQEVLTVGNQALIRVQLVQQGRTMDEVVVTGYQTQRKADLTGAVSVVKMDDIRTSPNANVMQSLQGRIPGVKIGADGTPGSGGVSIRIRGFGSLGNNDPLYIIDGLPTNNPSDVTTLSQSEIESIQVLKDASSASIYGSRAANGVIIITTKKGKGGNKVLLESRVGIQTLARRIETLNAQQYGDMLWQALKNDGLALRHPQYGTGPDAVIPQFLDNNPNVPAADTDWLKEIFQNAITQTHTVTISNGGERGSSLLSLNYLNQDGLMNTTNYNRYSLRLNSEYKVTKAFKIGQNLSLSRAKTNMYSSSGAFQSSGSMFGEALAQQPLLPVYNADGTYAGPMSQMGDARNPVARLNQTKDNYTYDSRAFGNIYADLNLSKNFTFRSNLAVDYRTTNSYRYEPKWSEGQRANALNSLTLGDELYTSWVWNNVLNYKLRIKDIHQIDALVGTEAAKFSTDFKNTSRQNFASDARDYRYLSAGEGTQIASGAASVNTLLSFFGKVNYSLMDKYLFSATLRHDGSSKLGAIDNSGVFPAFSLGWRVSEENFLKNSEFVSDLKLRYGWGRTGNQEIANYATFNTWSPSVEYASYDINGTNTSAIPGYMRVQMGNPKLRWETTMQHNLGIDISLFNNRIQVSMDYFYKKSTDMLIQPPVAAVVGEGAFPYINGADMENKGFEFVIGLKERQGSAFRYNVDFNFDIIRNKVTRVNGVSFFESGRMARTLVGYPVSSFYGFVTDGLFQNDAEVASHARQPGAKPGLIRFKDINKDGMINALDRDFIGNPHPKFSYGFNLGSGYKNFDISMFFNGVQGNDIYTRSVRQRLDFYNNNFGRSTRALNAWTPANTNTNIPMLSTRNPSDGTRHSDYFVEDGSYLKLKALNLGYTFNKSLMKQFKVENLYVFLQIQDVFTITRYEGTDPELRSSVNPLSIGLDNNLYPMPRTFTFGCNVGF